MKPPRHFCSTEILAPPSAASAGRAYLDQRSVDAGDRAYLARLRLLLETLFCDEADGALDSERKRMFMQMKLEVLRLGGYVREYFASQIRSSRKWPTS